MATSRAVVQDWTRYARASEREKERTKHSLLYGVRSVATVKPERGRFCGCAGCFAAPRRPNRMIVNGARLLTPPISKYHPARRVPALLADLRSGR